MQAIHMTRAGDPDVLQLVEIAEPQLTADDQIKVALKAAGLNPIDTKLRQRGMFFGNVLPAIPGCDGAGIVTETGKAVQHLKTGDEVWFCYGGLGRDSGNYAEFTVIPAAFATPKPRNMDFMQAAAGPLVLLTAWEALFERARLQAGQTVLIHAGAGGVGHVAIQLAKQAGARVLTTVSDTAKADFVKQLGADAVINYRKQDLAETVLALTEQRGVDIAFDTVGPAVFQQSIPLVAPYGDLVTLLDPGKDIDWKEARTRNLRISFELMLTPQLYDLPQALAHQAEILRQCAGLIEAGKLVIHVGKIFPLQEAAAAHRLLEQGHTQGKIVLRMD